MVLYGFRAAYRALDVLGVVNSSDIDRLQSSDWDVICTGEEFLKLYKSFPEGDVISAKPILGARYFIKTKKGVYDIHILDNTNSSNKVMYNNTSKQFEIEDNYGNKYNPVDLHQCLEIKKSHRMIRKNFSKTMEDYHRFKYLVRSPYETEFYRMRLAETLVRAKKATKHINLDQGSDDFFDTKGVIYDYDHDSIHESIKLTDVPMYKRLLKDGEDVLCDKSKWDEFTQQERDNCVLEEAYTIAIERFLCKEKSTKTRYEAFLTALEKICTTLCKGWFREHAYENYIRIKLQYNEDFFDKFNEALTTGKILPFTEKEKNETRHRS